ncbi:MAG: hypothetical protein ACREX0_14420 [Noviherbaspirillum sp.]
MSRRASGHASDVLTSAESYLQRAGEALVDCLILDIDLDGISGLALQKRLSRAQAMAMACAAYLRKPFESGALLHAVQGALKRV